LAPFLFGSGRERGGATWPRITPGQFRLAWRFSQSSILAKEGPGCHPDVVFPVWIGADGGLGPDFAARLCHWKPSQRREGFRRLHRDGTRGRRRPLLRISPSATLSRVSGPSSSLCVAQGRCCVARAFCLSRSGGELFQARWSPMSAKAIDRPGATPKGVVPIDGLCRHRRLAREPSPNQVLK
jgi:hypothetical protein